MPRVNHKLRTEIEVGIPSTGATVFPVQEYKASDKTLTWAFATHEVIPSDYVSNCEGYVVRSESFDVGLLFLCR